MIQIYLYFSGDAGNGDDYPEVTRNGEDYPEVKDYLNHS